MLLGFSCLSFLRTVAQAGLPVLLKGKGANRRPAVRKPEAVVGAAAAATNQTLARVRRRKRYRGVGTIFYVTAEAVTYKADLPNMAHKLVSAKQIQNRRQGCRRYEMQSMPA